jgi:hypothetical protein
MVLFRVFLRQHAILILMSNLLKRRVKKSAVSIDNPDIISLSNGTSYIYCDLCNEDVEYVDKEIRWWWYHLKSDQHRENEINLLPFWSRVKIWSHQEHYILLGSNTATLDPFLYRAIMKQPEPRPNPIKVPKHIESSTGVMLVFFSLIAMSWFAGLVISGIHNSIPGFLLATIFGICFIALITFTAGGG